MLEQLVHLRLENREGPGRVDTPLLLLMSLNLLQEGIPCEEMWDMIRDAFSLIMEVYRDEGRTLNVVSDEASMVIDDRGVLPRSPCCLLTYRQLSQRFLVFSSRLPLSGEIRQTETVSTTTNPLTRPHTSSTITTERAGDWPLKEAPFALLLPYFPQETVQCQPSRPRSGPPCN